MKSGSVLGFLALMMAPALHAELIGLVRGVEQARFFALSGALSTFVVACLLTGTFYGTVGGDAYLYAELPLFSSGHSVHFAIDSLSGPLLPLLTLLSLALVTGGPVTLLTRAKLRALLWLEALSLLTLISADLAVLALGWSLVLVPKYLLMKLHDDRVERHLLSEDSKQGRGVAAAMGATRRFERSTLTRVYRIYHLFGLACFLVGAGLLAYYTRPSGFFDRSLLHLDTEVVPPGMRTAIFALLCIAGLTRMGIAPFHSWLPLALERGSLLSIAFLVSMRTGLYLMARLAIPAFPHAARAAMPLLTGVALFSSVYGAIAALGQHNLRRMVGLLIISQSGIMLTGLVFGDHHAVSGMLLYWIGFATATTGLVLMIGAITVRTGVSDMRKFGGIVGRVPNLAACFFLFGLATIAIPGTVAFAAEDMLVHGALEAHPLLTLLMIFAMVVNAITVVRAFATTFLGNRALSDVPHGSIEDLLPRERVTAVALLIVLICAGLYPQVLIDAQNAAASRIAFIEEHAE